MAEFSLPPYPELSNEEIEKAARDLPSVLMNMQNGQPLNGLAAHHRKVFFLPLVRELSKKGHSEAVCHFAIHWCRDRGYVVFEEVTGVFGSVREGCPGWETIPSRDRQERLTPGPVPTERTLVVSTDALWEWRKNLVGPVFVEADFGRAISALDRILLNHDWRPGENHLNWDPLLTLLQSEGISLALARALVKLLRDKDIFRLETAIHPETELIGDCGGIPLHVIRSGGPEKTQRLVTTHDKWYGFLAARQHDEKARLTQELPAAAITRDTSAANAEQPPDQNDAKIEGVAKHVLAIASSPATLCDALRALQKAAISFPDFKAKGSVSACIELAGLAMEAIFKFTNRPPIIPGKDAALWAYDLRKESRDLYSAMYNASFRSAPTKEEDPGYFGDRRRSHELQCDRDLIAPYLSCLSFRLDDLNLMDGMETVGGSGAISPFPATTKPLAAAMTGDFSEQERENALTSPASFREYCAAAYEHGDIFPPAGEDWSFVIRNWSGIVEELWEMARTLGGVNNPPPPWSPIESAQQAKSAIDTLIRWVNSTWPVAVEKLTTQGAESKPKKSQGRQPRSGERKAQLTKIAEDWQRFYGEASWKEHRTTDGGAKNQFCNQLKIPPEELEAALKYQREQRRNGREK